jgi:hypothetical protein
VRKDGKMAYKVAMEVWNEAEQERKDKRDTIKAIHDKAVAAWTKKKDMAVKKGKKFVEKKPKQDTLPKPIPKPKLKDFLGGSGGVEGADNSGDHAEDDGDENESESSASDNDDA